MNINKIKNVLVPIILFVIIILLIIRGFSFNLAIKLSGYSLDSVNYFHRSYDANEDEFMVISTLSKDTDLAILRLTKNIFGLWQITDKMESRDSEVGTIVYTWVQTAGKQHYVFGKDTIFGWEVHILYCGSNAKELIQFKPGQIPENITVNIQQDKNLYYIHLISYGDVNNINNFDILNILLENGSITG